MFYKRSEYFRYTFGDQLEAKLHLIVAGNGETESKPGECLIIDISPSGAKIFSAYEFPVNRESLKLHIHFQLHEEIIDVTGKIVWRKPSKGGYLYGFEFADDVKSGEVIIDQLKKMRAIQLHEEKGKNKS
jgi:hypothetical protein